MKLRFVGSIAVLLLLAVSSFAATTATNATSVSPSVLVQTNVVTALVLQLSQDTTGGGCAINAGGTYGASGTTDYNVSFGTVDGLGLSTPSNACIHLATPATMGSGPAVYYTTYRITPLWAHFAASAQGVITSSLAVDFTNSQHNGTPGALGITDTTAAPTSATAIRPVASTALYTEPTSGTTSTRYLGVSVAPVNNGATGADLAVVTYTLTPQ